MARNSVRGRGQLFYSKEIGHGRIGGGGKQEVGERGIPKKTSARFGAPILTWGPLWPYWPTVS